MSKGNIKDSFSHVGDKVPQNSEALAEFEEYCMQFFEKFQGRDEEVLRIKYAVLTQSHILFKGLPGSAKSMLVNSFIDNIHGSKNFKQQFSAFMDEAYIFGPQDIEELKKGRIVHNTENSLVDCHFASLDEFFNANEETIIACNEIFNERTFTRNTQKLKSPLITAFMTTNQNRENEVKLKPIYDRILFKCDVKPLTNRYRRIALYKSVLDKSFFSFKPIQFSTVQKAIEFVRDSKVIFPNYILEAYDETIQNYEETGQYVSMRAAVKGLDVLKVSALLNGRFTVNSSDFSVLETILIHGGDEKTWAVFQSILNPILTKLASAETNLDDFENLNSNFSRLKGLPAKGVTGKELLAEIDVFSMKLRNLLSAHLLTENEMKDYVSVIQTLREYAEKDVTPSEDDFFNVFDKS